MAYSPQTAADMANLVQCVYNMYGTGTNPNPPADPGLATMGYQVEMILTAKDIDAMKFYGIIASSKANPGDLVLAIRGTKDFTEWLLDFDAVPLPFMGMGFVAAGFRSIADTFSLMDGSGTSHGLSDAITVLNAQAAITSLTILGHSLGSALATLAAAQLASQNPAGVKPLISVWTYASPRVGLADFMGNYNNEVPANYRIWNSLDLVPQVPVYPYVHVGGDGEKLDQSEQEMQELETTPGCEHNLATYQWLLDTKDFQIPQGCAIVADLATAAAPEVIGAHAMEAAPSAAGERAQGRSAMYRAMHGV